MRFFIDGRYLRADYHDGISRFTHSLIHAVSEKIRPTIILHNASQRALLPDNVDVVTIHAPTSVLEPLSAKILNRYAPDVVFSPMQTIGSFGKKFGLILTLHDLIYYQHRTPPKNLPQAVRGLWYLYHLSYLPQRLLLNRADAVATVSKISQRLIRQNRLTSKTVHLISNAPQHVEFPRDPTAPADKRLIYMGSYMAYKNVEILIRAMKLLPEYQLHLCSRITDSRYEELKNLAIQHGVKESQLIFHDGVSDQKYRDLLRTATALITMSGAEGYGLPVVEAMAEGTPVILSDLEIFEEIGGLENPGALFVSLNASKPEQQIAEHIQHLDSHAVFTSASYGAVQQAAKFQWSDSADALIAMAEDIHQRRLRSKTPPKVADL